MPGGRARAARRDDPVDGDGFAADPARLALALSAADVGCFDWDLTQGRLLGDDRLHRIFGAAPDGPDGPIASFWALLLPADRPRVARLVREALDTRGEFEAECRVVRTDGAVRWVHARGRVLTGPDGTPARMLGVARDSTELRSARDSVARALEQMADAFVALDPDWRVSYLNRPAADLMDVDRAGAPGRSLWSLWPALLTGGQEEALRAAAAAAEPTSMRLYDGAGDRWHDLRIVPGTHGVSLFAAETSAGRTGQHERDGLLTRLEQAGRVLAYSQALAQADSVSDVADVIATMVLPAFHASGLLVSLAESGKLRVAGNAGYPPEALRALDGLPIDADSPTAEVMRTRHPLFVPSMRAYLDRYPEMREIVALTGKQSWAFLPLTVSGRALGCLTLSFDEARELAPEERSLVVALAGLLAQTFERARLRDAERGLAAELQRGLLPKALSRHPGLTASSRYLPATDGMQVGGDWYELIALSEDRVGLVIGDVQGHNVHAASTMGQLRYALRAYAAEGHDAVAVMSRSNRMMADIDPSSFATCCFVEVDLRAQRALVVRAGHPPPLLRSADGTTTVPEGPVGLPLGVDPDEVYVAVPLDLAPGDTVVLLTDGLVEDSRTPMDAGLERVAEAVRATPVQDLERFADVLMAEPTSARHRSDDIALLVVRHDGLGDGHRPPTVRRSIDRRDPRAARHARELSSEVLREWQLVDLRETTGLLVSEVVTNALRHTEGPVELTFSRLPGRLRVEVADDAATPPAPWDGRGRYQSGRGIALIGDRSDRWGTEPRGTGKVVWFELEAPG